MENNRLLNDLEWLGEGVISLLNVDTGKDSWEWIRNTEEFKRIKKALESK